jgi:SanA protein
MRLALCLALVLGAALLAAATVAWLAERSLDWQAAPRLATAPAGLPAVEVGLVLGAAPIGPEGGPNRYLEYRLDAAAELWRSGRVRYLLLSGAPGEPAAMRAGLIARGVTPSAVYRDELGFRTRDSIRRARLVYGQTRLIVVSQRFHLARALFLARADGIDAWGLEARDVDRAYSIFTELRRYPSALRAYWDVWFAAPPDPSGAPVRIGVDSAN